MKKLFILFLISGFLMLGFKLYAQTSLTATEGTPTLDGVASPGEWTSDMITTQKGLTIKAMIDANYLYVLATWADVSSTKNVDKSQWSFDGTSWTQSGVEDEDRVGIIWDMGQNGTEGVNCLTMCHPPIMNTATGKVDVWHWKAARTNPLGYADDKWWFTDGRHGDSGTDTDPKNSPMGSGFPSFMAASDPGANVHFLMSDQAALNAFDPFGVIEGAVDLAVPFDSTMMYSAGAIIPGRILSIPTGNRASVQAAGKYDNGVWTVEFRRLLAGDEDDFTVVPGGSVQFATEIFDNEGHDHPNDGFDATVYTLNFPTPTGTPTSLTATIGTPTLDGVASPGEWTSDMITTQKGLTVKAMIDQNNLYVLTTWADVTSTKNVDKSQWSFDGTSWSQAGDEDRVGIVWDMGQNGTEGANCLTMCHPPIMNTATGKVDVWHWKGARTNPLGFSDDKWWFTDGRHGDSGTDTDPKNPPMGSGFPSFMAASDPGANVHFLMSDQAALSAFDPFGVIDGAADLAVAFDSTATFSAGAIIPGRILSLPTGNRASVRAAGKYDNGVWTVEFSRSLAGDEDDFTVVPGGSVQFATEIFDDQGSTHANDGFDATVFTMNFPPITGVESYPEIQVPETYVLHQNFPNPFNPTTSITFDIAQPGRTVLKIYNLIGQEIGTLIDGNLNAGSHRVEFDASKLSSGVYVYKLSINGFTAVKKMAIIK